MKKRILVVEDDAELGGELSRQLESAGYETTWVRDGDAAIRLSIDEYALVLLDLMLPGAYGLDILKQYRAKSEVPVLLLTARDHTADKVRGLALGADDYITKPFFPDELLARIHARLRRPNLERAANAVIRVGELEVDVAGRRVQMSGRVIELTPVEFAIVELLARRAGRAVTRHALAEHVLDETRGGDARTLDVHVSRLRKKLGDDGRMLATVWGIGYRLGDAS